MTAITFRELVALASEVSVFQIMGRLHIRSVTVDYLPAHGAQFKSRLPDDPPAEFVGPSMVSLTYVLDESMFGGETYAALTCMGHVVVAPFRFTDFEDLAQCGITLSSEGTGTNLIEIPSAPQLKDGRHATGH